MFSEPWLLYHGDLGDITAWLSKEEKSNGSLSGIKNGILLKLSNRFILGLCHSQTDWISPIISPSLHDIPRFCMQMRQRCDEIGLKCLIYVIQVKFITIFTSNSIVPRTKELNKNRFWLYPVGKWPKIEISVRLFHLSLVNTLLNTLTINHQDRVYIDPPSSYMGLPGV